MKTVELFDSAIVRHVNSGAIGKITMTQDGFVFAPHDKKKGHTRMAIRPSSIGNLDPVPTTPETLEMLEDQKGNEFEYKGRSLFLLNYTGKDEYMAIENIGNLWHVSMMHRLLVRSSFKCNHIHELQALAYWLSAGEIVLRMKP